MIKRGQHATLDAVDQQQLAGATVLLLPDFIETQGRHQVAGLVACLLGGEIHLDKEHSIIAVTHPQVIDTG